MPIDSQSPQGNNWNVYLGVAVEDKEQFSRDLKVYIQEILPFMQGEIKPAQEKKVLQNSDNLSTSVETSNCVTAKYFDFNTNRRYAPDIRKNEQMLVLNQKDSDEYYWLSLGRDDKLRLLERLNFSVSGSSSPVGELTDDNTYYFEMDTLHNKRIILRSSKVDGEEYRYTFMIDTKESKVYLCDDGDNEFLIESKVPRIRMHNRDGALIDLAQKNITIVAPEDLLIKVGRHAVFDMPSWSFKNTENSGATEWNINDLNINSSKSIVLTSPSIELDGAVHAKNIVSGHHQASGYSTGEEGSTYSGVSIDKENGNGSNPQNDPNYGSGGNDNRHCAAWDEVCPALYAIADCLDSLGASCDTSAIRSLADRCKMNLNRGE